MLLVSEEKIEMNKILKYLSSLFLGNIRYQNLFGFLYRLSLEGMNIGGGSDYKNSGELATIKYVSSKFSNNKLVTVFDVGANVGKYSKLLSENFSGDTNIYSFEPSLVTHSELAKNVRGVKNITPINIGFSDKTGNGVLYSDKKKSGLASIYDRRLNHFGIILKNHEKIKLTTIDEYSRKNNIRRINFLKIDAEGNEFKILKGANKMLSKKKINYIQFEFGGCNIDSRTFLQDFYYLFGKNYKLYRIVKNGIYPLGSYKEHYECFVTTNYLAELNK